MISAIVAIIAGWLLAAKVRPTWLGIADCIVAGAFIGTASVAVAAHTAVLPVVQARIPGAVFEASVRFSFVALVFYAIQRLVMRRAKKSTGVGKPVPSDSRECPYCAELIKTRAVVCKHCGKDLSP